MKKMLAVGSPSEQVAALKSGDISIPPFLLRSKDETLVSFEAQWYHKRYDIPLIAERPAFGMSNELRAAQKEADQAKKRTRLAALKESKIDHTGQRWDMKIGKWVDMATGVVVEKFKSVDTKPKRVKATDADRFRQTLVLLAEREGMTAAEFTNATGRSQPAPILSGLKRLGHVIERFERSKGIAAYRLVKPPEVPAPVAPAVKPAKAKKKGN